MKALRFPYFSEWFESLEIYICNGYIHRPITIIPLVGMDVTARQFRNNEWVERKLRTLLILEKKKLRQNMLYICLLVHFECIFISSVKLNLSASLSVISPLRFWKCQLFEIAYDNEMY